MLTKQKGQKEPYMISLGSNEGMALQESQSSSDISSLNAGLKCH